MTALASVGFDLVLCALILSAALFATAMRDQFASSVSFIIYGVFIAIAWLRLGATDVALTEAALGAGLTGVLLIGGIARLQRLCAQEMSAVASHQIGRSSARARSILTMVAAGALSCALGWGFVSLPVSRGLSDAVAGSLAASGVGNPVTAVLLNFRAWDTLLESVVLLAALVGLWSLARDEDWGRRPGVRQHAREGGVMATFGRFLPPFGLLLGIYLVWTGSSQPGGAFQGGTVLAAVWLLVMMAGLQSPPHVTSTLARSALVIGPVVFLCFGLAGAAAGVFLGVPPAVAKPMILMIEAALTLSIAATLALLILGSPTSDGDGPDAPTQDAEQDDTPGQEPAR